MTARLQLEWFLVMIWTGWQLTAALDALRVTIRSGRLPSWLGYVLEFLFALLAGMYLFRQIYIINGGEIRGAFFIAAGIGGWIYWRFFRKSFRLVTESIVRIIRLVLQYCKRFLNLVMIRPIVWILRLFYSLFLKILMLIQRMIPLPIKIALTKYRNRIKILVQRLTKFD